ncbi:uncharacterized protein OCT59_008467 [Rhizophagus irregularis]|uniref:uncharacterized protein n=1 Tax=Rhizophagus irregularis TaxID=588596 RepID=UPI003318DC34|nr:hypothetical protein OCT59_008467 [Rhizophagus irregularis]
MGLYGEIDNRPDTTELSKSLSSISMNNQYKTEIEEAEKYRILHLSSSKVDRQYTDDNPDNSECLDCAI